MVVGADTRPSRGAHLVHFYDDEDDLAVVIRRHLAVGLADDEYVVVIGTPAVATTLVAADSDLSAARADGRVVALDAAEMLDRFMVRGVPDPAAFDASVGELMRSACATGCGVRAYGEMVALLWEEGNVAGAVQLERLWDALADELGFTLLCAYPAQLVAGTRGAEAFAEVCDLHSGVVAGAPEPDGCEVVRRFARGPHASRLARRFVVDTLSSWGRRELIDDAVIVVAELATNAVQHGRSDLTVGIARRGSHITVAVGDADATTPAPREADATSLGGRGLLLVDGIARRWGCEPAGSGKVVWAELTADEESVA